jgi:hypothetical protein
MCKTNNLLTANAICREETRILNTYTNKNLLRICHVIL